MTKKFQKILCLLISSVIVVSSFSIAASAGEKCDCENTPIVYIKGRAGIYADKNDLNSERLDEFDTEMLTEYLPGLVANYYICYKKDDFSSFSHKLASVLYKCYEGYQLDENGEAPNNSGRLPNERWQELRYEEQGEHLSYDEWLEKRLTPEHEFTDMNHTAEEAYDNLYKFPYNYDARKDPCEIADDLEEYIEYIKELTGHDKVKIVCRCLGTSIFAAYLCEYGYEDIEDVVFYNPLYNGSVIADNIFTGEFYLDADSLDNTANEFLDGSVILSVLAKIISLANSTYQLDMTANYFNKTLVKVGKQVFPESLLATYGTCPGYWTMVSAEAYEEAKSFVFCGIEDKYAGLIKKLDNYHNNVALKANDVIKQMAEDGVNVYYIAKYNCQLYPLVSKEDSAINSDNIISVSQQAPGTIAADMGTTFSKNYVISKSKNGLGKYISPDKMIDTSGTMFPDRTWFIKDLDHDSYPYIVDYMIETILRSNGTMDVNSNENYPQYLIYEGELNNGDTLSPLDDNHPGKSYEKKSFFEILKDIFELIFNALSLESVK